MTAPPANICTNGHVPPTNFREIDGDFYKKEDSTNSYLEAKAVCQGYGAQLPVFRTEKQYRSLQFFDSE